MPDTFSITDGNDNQVVHELVHVPRHGRTSPIRDEWNVDTSENWQTPTDTYQHYLPDSRTDTYVSVTASFVGSWLDTYLYCLE